MQSGEPNLYVSGVKWDEHSVPPLINRINCTPSNGCEKCCSELKRALVTEEDIERIAEHLRRNPQRLRLKWRAMDGQYFIPQPCEFLVPGEGCGIYEVRPAICQVFPLQKVNSPEGYRVGVTTQWCTAGLPCVALLERWQGTYRP